MVVLYHNAKSCVIFEGGPHYLLQYRHIHILHPNVDLIAPNFQEATTAFPKQTDHKECSLKKSQKKPLQTSVT